MTGFERFWFFSCLSKKFVHTFLFIYFFGGGGAKNPKKNFNQFSHHFLQFWTTLIFFHVWQKRFYIPYWFCSFNIFFWPIFSPFHAISNNFDFFYFPGWGGGEGENEIKANLSQNWSFSLSLAELGNK